MKLKGMLCSLIHFKDLSSYFSYTGATLKIVGKYCFTSTFPIDGA